MKQCKLYDKENDTVCGGLILDDGRILCACCGSIIESDDEDIEIMKIYDEWVDFSETIISDCLTPLECSITNAADKIFTNGYPYAKTFDFSPTDYDENGVTVFEDKNISISYNAADDRYDIIGINTPAYQKWFFDLIGRYIDK